MKRIAIMIVLLSMLFPAGAFAHATLKHAAPGDQEVVTQPLTEIVLEFNSRIENLSTLALLDGQGQEIPVQTSVGKTTLTGTLQEPLSSGQYQVIYNIVAADGHRIEKEYSFTVDLPVQEETTAPEDSAATEEGAETPQAERQPSEPEPAQEPSGDNSLYYYLGAGAILFIVALAFVRRKK
ncbi:copper resistance CopC family protein [Paenibacillus sp.]|uniref:copper resistance CopC family protein n=1 Tax=Paenibacillus sp. TaxID=58172 RepID=UPI002D51674C|nr:copper resistance protein CopC [Paenibacillus sp.]HZG83650.1 copper resistance protein CopC [Paenibacillus sp.]